MDLLELAARCESASGAEEQRALLEQAFSAIYPGLQLPAPGAYWPPLLTSFVRMLDAEAFESAAMTLVPEGFGWSLGHRIGSKAGAILNATAFAKNALFAEATTPALALTAAALKALAQGATS